LDQQKCIVFKPTNFQLKALAMSYGKDASYLKEVQEALQNDPFVENIRKRLRANEVNNEFKFMDGLLYFKGLLYIPPRPTQLKIIQMRHDLPVAGHILTLTPKDLGVFLVKTASNQPLLKRRRSVQNWIIF
jgi:hypothetical protein